MDLDFEESDLRKSDRIQLLLIGVAFERRRHIGLATADQYLAHENVRQLDLVAPGNGHATRFTERERPDLHLPLAVIDGEEQNIHGTLVAIAGRGFEFG